MGPIDHLWKALLLTAHDKACTSSEPFSTHAVQALPRMRDLMATWQRKAKLVWLLGCTSNASDAEMAAFAAYGDAIGPDKVPRSACCPAGTWTDRMDGPPTGC